MDTYEQQKDLQLLCAKATSFPDGIADAHTRISALLPNVNRQHYGISYPIDGEIVYFAAIDAADIVGNVPNDVSTFTLKKGKYIRITIKDFHADISRISSAFEVLTDDPRIDPQGCCVEKYSPAGSDGNAAKDVGCMVRLAD